jgi:cysteine-rich repeat protein
MRMKIILILIGILATLINFSYMVSGIDITACGTLNQSNATYTLQNNLTATATCFTIGANNITLDLNWYNITGDDNLAEYGIQIQNYNSTTIKNGGFYDFVYGVSFNRGSKNTLINLTSNSNTATGIEFSSSSNNILTNVTANLNAAYGITLSTGDNNTLTSITTNSNVDGIYFTSSLNNTFTYITSNSNQGGGIILSTVNNSFLTNITANLNYLGPGGNGNDGLTLETSSGNIITNISVNYATSGVDLETYSHNNIIRDFKLFNFTTNSGSAIDMSDANNNTFENGYINQSDVSGVAIRRCSNNTFKDIWTNINYSEFQIASYVGDEFSTINNIILNYTFLKNGTFEIYGDQDMEFIRQWYADIQVNDSSGYLASANVNITNITGTQVFYGTTNATGQITKQALTEYRVYGTTFSPVYQTPHNFTASKSGYNSNSSSYNLTSLKNFLYSVILSLAPSCGDGTINSGETCDDGNTISGDGCSNVCATETAATATGGGSYPIFNPSREIIKEEFTKIFQENWKVKFKANGGNHTFKVVKINNSSVKISVASELIEATLSPGEEEKFEISGDDYYDLFVKINSIEIIKNRAPSANITLKSIHELIPGPIIEEQPEEEKLKETIEKENAIFVWKIIAVLIGLLIVRIMYQSFKKNPSLFMKRKHSFFYHRSFFFSKKETRS